MPENRVGAITEKDSTPEADESPVSAAATLDKMLASTERALEKASPRVQALEEPSQWRVSYFITDIAITFQGLLGLVVKGTPTVEMSWFPQYPAQQAAHQAPVSVLRVPPEKHDPKAESEIVVTSDASMDQLSRQINPALRAALGTGLVQDGEGLKNELIAQVTSFQKMIRVLERNPGVEWWPSRYRVDFNIDASGKLTPALEAGGGVRLRLAWYRMKRIVPKPTSSVRAPSTDTGIDERSAQTLGFVTALAEDIQKVSDQLDDLNGFKAYSVKVAVATSLKGTVGIAKASGSIAGYLYFSRDVPKPVVNPPPAAKILSMIDRTASEAPIRYAMDNGIHYAREGSDTVVYDVDRDEFKDGLRKAAKIASFFTERAAQLKPDTKEAAWKIYELVIGYELSVSGDVGLVQLGGSAITEISFYNQKF